MSKNSKTFGGSGTAGDMGGSSASSTSGLFPRLDRFVIEACVTVELLPLELLDLFVAVVCVVEVDTIDGEVKRDLAANTAL